MKLHINSIILVFCLFVLPGYFTNSKKQVNWAVTLSKSKKTAINSTVDIPCNIAGPDDPGKYHLIWYEYGVTEHQQVYNSDNQSQVHPDYINRTSRIGGGANCSLRIINVTRTAWYFPEITGDSYKINKEENPVMISVTGCLNRATCSDWSFTFPTTIDALEGSCLEIPCTLTHPENITDFNLIWFLRTKKGDKIFNTTTIHKEIKREGITSLVQARNSNCSLWIDYAKKEEQYYPGVSKVITAPILDGKRCKVSATGKVPNPKITGIENLIESKAVNIICSVAHICASRSLSVEMRIDNIRVNITSKNLTQNELKVYLQYVPSLEHNNKSMECKAIYSPPPKEKEKMVKTNVILHIHDNPRCSLIIVITIIVVLGIICFLLLVLLVLMYKRKKIYHRPAVTSETTEIPEPTYASLDKKEVEETYDTLKTYAGGQSSTGNEYGANK
ncbi:hypothetical protein GDO81_021052 [Engystomops pustulosus]|uniref:Ig-like domain-containing protein n=1 Tax=Engystomops pustulosus TaxID=76066 RepID=A0AAV6ZJD1_ENGPU|nr:hypothetical protein GDO81_021052 [Engystomops pustulosus]